MAIQPPRPPGHRIPRPRRGPNDKVSSCSSVTRHRRSRYPAESLIRLYPGRNGNLRSGDLSMTERKPPEISFVSWIDQQISEAAERGAFDNLPGAGKPLPRGEIGGDAWLRNYLAREGVAAEELLPTPLKLRKERERLAETVPGLRTEAEVRDVVRDLNRRIMEWRRIPTGPSIFLSLLGEEAMVSRWRQAQTAVPAPALAAACTGASSPEPSRPRWWRRLGRRRA